MSTLETVCQSIALLFAGAAYVATKTGDPYVVTPLLIYSTVALNVISKDVLGAATLYLAYTYGTWTTYAQAEFVLYVFVIYSKSAKKMKLSFDVE